MASQATEQVSETALRGPRPRQVGVVTSDKRDKTITVVVQYTVRHTKYGKYQRWQTRHQVHDENNEAIAGDRVEIMQCRPLSKTKSWRLVRIVDKAPREGVQ